MPDSSSQAIPAGLVEALQAASSTKRRDVRLLTTFESLEDVTSTKDSRKFNKFDLFCPRDGCGSIILKEEIAELREREAVTLEPPHLEPHPLLPKVAEAGQKSEWWLIAPSPMQFENIGFSKPVEGVPPGPGGKPIQFLACAECDLGPLGWTEQGKDEFWIVPSRVGYGDPDLSRCTTTAYRQSP